jgi:hypothetical protein
MKNNKGFTIIELAVSFCLVAAVSITLLQLVLTLKEVYLSGDVKTTLLNKQGIMTKKIYDDLNSYTLTEINSCGISCLSFSYSDLDEDVKLIVDPGNQTLTYGDYTIKLDSSSYFGKLEITTDVASEPLGTNDSIFKINIPIISKLLDEDLGIHIIKIYDSSITSISNTLDLSNLSSTDVVATINGIDLTKDDVLYYSEDEVTNFFLRVYHQEANNYFTDYDNFIKNSNSTTFSILGALSVFKQTINLENVIEAEIEAKTEVNSSELSDKEKKRKISSIKEDYQNGYYSLLLNYNDEDLSGNYSWWYQTSNFAAKEAIKGFSITGSNLSVNLINGITYNNSDTSTSWAKIIGKDTNYGLGITSGDITYPDGTATSIDLYAEAREYICNYGLSDVKYNGESLNTFVYSDGYVCSSKNETATESTNN